MSFRSTGPYSKKPSREELVERFLYLGKHDPERRAVEFWSIKKAATVLGCSRSTIQRWIDEGKLAFTVVLGRQWVYGPYALDLARKALS